MYFKLLIGPFLIFKIATFWVMTFVKIDICLSCIILKLVDMKLLDFYKKKVILLLPVLIYYMDIVTLRIVFRNFNGKKTKGIFE